MGCCELFFYVRNYEDSKKKYCQNKKVLLRERKRHTARCVLSTPSVVLPGYPPSCCPTWVPPHPDLGGVPYLGTPWAGYPPWQGTPWAGYPPGRIPPPKLDLAGYHPPPRCLSHGILGNVAKHYGIWVPPGVCPMAFWVMLQSIMRYGYPPPPPVDR